MPTLVDKFLENVSKRPNDIYLTQPMGGDVNNLKTYTFAQVAEEAKKMAGYIESQGYPPKSHIAICSKNCAWWIIADIAIWMAGHVSVPIYPTLTADTVSYIIEHSESKMLFVGKLDVKPWEEMKEGVPAGFSTVSFPLCPEGSYTSTWDDIISKTAPIAEVVKRDPDEMCTIIYTSGSTGKPKGVMHKFDALYVTTVELIKVLDATNKDRLLSYLPLAHGMSRWTDQCVTMYIGASVYFAETLKTFVQDLQRARPTLFLSVPRLWTKFQLGVNQKMPAEKLAKLLRIPIIRTIVKKKILKTLGLNYCRFAGSGSAPMPAELIQWYRDLGLELLEGYGMTENFNFSHMSKPGKARVGYVGNTHVGVEQRISEEGEIQVKSLGIMMGYYKNEEATSETMTEDGFLKTGDKGEIDEAGRLKITGRVKEIFKTSKGKYVAPAPIESKLIVHGRIELACVGGTGFPQPHAVIQLSEDAAAKVKADPSEKDVIGKELATLLAEVNPTLDGHEQLQFLAVVSDEWLPENGFLTPTQKIKRGKIEETYKPFNETWYDSKDKVIWHGF